MTEDDKIDKAFNSMKIECQHGIKTIIKITWYLITSRGKLLMMRRQVRSYPHKDLYITEKVEVFEADMSVAKWVPVEGGLGGHALFISRRFCKSISAACSKEIQEDALYFIDTNDVFDMRSKTIRARRDSWEYIEILMNCNPDELTWVFPPELVA
jgi:hypothetical protein